MITQATRSAAMGVFFRSEQKRDGVLDVRHTRATHRPPGNVPYLVDNLWEWSRPEGFPCRRRSVFASPTIELAKQNGPTGGTVYRVEFLSKASVVQMEDEDARYHQDIRALQRLVLGKLGQEWVDGSCDVKQGCSLLWVPCLRQQEVQAVLERTFERGFIEDLLGEITIWSSARMIEDFASPLPFGKGEVFFEAEQWRLVDLA